MTRRGFFATLAAGATLDPERLLWRPGAKLISIPKPIQLPRYRIDLDQYTAAELIADAMRWIGVLPPGVAPTITELRAFAPLLHEIDLTTPRAPKPIRDHFLRCSLGVEMMARYRFPGAAASLRQWIPA